MAYLSSLSQSTVTFCPPPRRVVAIVNTHSGFGRGERLLAMLRNKSWSAEVTAFETKPNSLEAHQAAIDFARANNADRLLVAGGDGTIMETLTLMLNSGDTIPVYVIPVGTGNVVASDLSVPRRMRPALRQAFQPGILRWWEAGQLENTGQYFVLRASAGHDARTLAAIPPQAKQRWGLFAYALPAMRELLRINPIRFTITIDDQQPFKMRGITAFVAVTTRVASLVDIVISRDIHPDDDVLHVGVLHPYKVWRNLPRAVPNMLNPAGSLETNQFVSTFPVQKSVRIDADPPQPMQIDGELLDIQTPLMVRTVPHAVPFVTPYNI